MRVLILLYICPHTAIYVSSYFCTYVLIQALESWAQAMVLVRAQASARLERARGGGKEVREEVVREEVAGEATRKGREADKGGRGGGENSRGA
jgi:hypothetical protein